MEIEPKHMPSVRAHAAELAAIVAKEPDARMVSDAYRAIDRIIRALADVAPNHPDILRHSSALAVPIGR